MDEIIYLFTLFLPILSKLFLNIKNFWVTRQCLLREIPLYKSCTCESLAFWNTFHCGGLDMRMWCWEHTGMRTSWRVSEARHLILPRWHTLPLGQVFSMAPLKMFWWELFNWIWIPSRNERTLRDWSTWLLSSLDYRPDAPECILLFFLYCVLNLGIYFTFPTHLSLDSR